MDPQEANKAMSKITGDLSQEDIEKLQNADFPDMLKLMSSQVMQMMQSGDFNNSIQMITEEMQKPDVDLMKVFSKSMSNFSNLRENIKEPFDKPPRVEEIVDADVTDDSDIKPHTTNLNYTINVPLKELYTGVDKHVKIVRTNYKKGKDGKIEKFEEKKRLLIPIEKGSQDGDELVFKGESNRLPNHIPGDIIITLNTEPDKLFERRGDNLFIFKNLSVTENYSLSQEIVHLDGRILNIQQSKKDTSIVHSFNGTRKITGGGMPIKGTDKFGDLFIRFNLVLPEKLEPEKILLLSQVFEREKTSNDESIQTFIEEITENDLDAFVEDLDEYSDSDYSDYSETDSELDDRYESEIDNEEESTEHPSEKEEEKSLEDTK